MKVPKLRRMVSNLNINRYFLNFCLMNRLVKEARAQPDLPGILFLIMCFWIFGTHSLYMASSFYRSRDSWLLTQDRTISAQGRWSRTMYSQLSFLFKSSLISAPLNQFPTRLSSSIIWQHVKCLPLTADYALSNIITNYHHQTFSLQSF
jgi:hypothetical protein